MWVCLSLYRDLRPKLKHRPVREGVLGQVQVGQVGTAAPQQSPEQLAEKKRRGKPMRLRWVGVSAAGDDVAVSGALHHWMQVFGRQVLK